MQISHSSSSTTNWSSCNARCTAAHRTKNVLERSTARAASRIKWPVVEVIFHTVSLHTHTHNTKTKEHFDKVIRFPTNEHQTVKCVFRDYTNYSDRIELLQRFFHRFLVLWVRILVNEYEVSDLTMTWCYLRNRTHKRKKNNRIGLPTIGPISNFSIELSFLLGVWHK